jgi:hypothetical protein
MATGWTTGIPAATGTQTSNASRLVSCGMDIGNPFVVGEVDGA